MKVKIAGAPISWGVCEVPGWGHQMEPGRVLREMADLGLEATEFGPVGFLPTEPKARAELLKELGMQAIGGFYPILLHDDEKDPIPALEEELKAYQAAGAEVLVLAASTGVEGYDDERPVLTEVQWQVMYQNLARASELAERYGVTAVLHPHVGTMIESQEDCLRIIENTEMPFCLDTGHMLIGGTDPVEFSKKFGSRIKHSHLKDVNMSVATRVQNREISYYEGVQQGLYTPLGQGDVDVRAIIKNLVAAGFDGWLALEQDLVVSSEPAPLDGPIRDAKQSVEFIRQVAAEL